MNRTNKNPKIWRTQKKANEYRKKKMQRDIKTYILAFERLVSYTTEFLRMYYSVVIFISIENFACFAPSLLYFLRFKFHYNICYTYINYNFCECISSTQFHFLLSVFLSHNEYICMLYVLCSTYLNLTCTKIERENFLNWIKNYAILLLSSSTSSLHCDFILHCFLSFYCCSFLFHSFFRVLYVCVCALDPPKWINYITIPAAVLLNPK